MPLTSMLTWQCTQLIGGRGRKANSLATLKYFFGFEVKNHSKSESKDFNNT